MDINVFKTKDDCRFQEAISPVDINDHAVEIVHQFKYFGTVIDEKLTFEAHVCKKAHQRMYFLWKLCGFNVDSTFMNMFYSCFIESVITFSFVCLYG